MFRFRLSRKNGLIISVAWLLSFLLLNTTPSVAKPYKTTTPEEVTQHFYSWYLGANFPTPNRSNMATFRKYVTQSFLKRAAARDVDAVLFIDAQDTDATWANNFTVSKATISGQTATVQVALNGNAMKYNLRVSLKREGAAWKIDDVKGSDA